MVRRTVLKFYRFINGFIDSDWSAIPLANLGRYQTSLRSHLRLTTSLFDVHMSRKQQLTGFLMQAILMVRSRRFFSSLLNNIRFSSFYLALLDLLMNMLCRV